MTEFTAVAELTSPSSSLEQLATHPECGQWKAAILQRSRSLRWPGWNIEHALATVDSNLEIHFVEFLIQPPAGWKEDVQADLPDDVTLERIANEGLKASRAAPLLNKLFGSACVYAGGTVDRQKLKKFEEAAGARLTWHFASSWGWLGDDLTVPLDDWSNVTFRCNFPWRGTLAERVQSAAQSYVRAIESRLRISGMPV